MEHWTARIRVFRIAVLLTILLGALMLYRWSRVADPRFYRFLRSRPGQFLAQTFRWNAPPPAGLEDDKPESEMSEEERAVKRELEAQIASSVPQQRLVLDTGKTMIGEVLEEHPDHVVFLETYGESGSLSVKVRRARIKSIESVKSEPPKITYRDVRFQMEFPKMNLYRRPPYTILTDETYFHVEQSVRVLQGLHEEFLDFFRPLIARERSGENIQLLFFSDQRSFDEYQQTFAPHMAGVLGFYSPWLDRFIVFNEKRSDQIVELTQSVEEQAEQYADDVPAEPAADRIRMLKRQLQRGMEHSAEKRTYTTLRHEGAHQLFFTYGVHSADRVENDWLVEGLATFCETRRIGEKEPRRVELLRNRLAAGDGIPLAELVNFRDAAGFAALGNPDRVDLAYCQSWALVRYLMEPVRRHQFFEYVGYIRDPAQFYSVLRKPRMEVLCRFLDQTPEQLEAAWADYVRKL